jgi:hypothetical protein
MCAMLGVARSSFYAWRNRTIPFLGRWRYRSRGDGTVRRTARASPIEHSAPVFVQTDNLAENTIVDYDCAPDGSLRQAGVYQTGGKGGALTGAVVDFWPLRFHWPMTVTEEPRGQDRLDLPAMGRVTTISIRGMASQRTESNLQLILPGTVVDLRRSAASPQEVRKLPLAIIDGQ